MSGTFTIDCSTPTLTGNLNEHPIYRVIINDCPIAVGVGDVVECAASFIT
jgi:hypothetical protein